MLDPLRVAIDARTITPQETGIGHYAKALTEHLGRLPSPNSYLVFVPDSVPLQARWPSKLEYRPTRITPYNRLLRDPWYDLILPHHLDKWHAGVFHSANWLLPLGRLRQRAVITVHDLSHFRLRRLHKSLYGHLFRARARRSLKLADAIIADSLATKQDLIDFFDIMPERIAVVHLGVDERFRPKGDPAATRRLKARGVRTPYVLSVGTLEPRKNHIRLIEAFERVATWYPDLQLVLAGRRGWLCESTLTRIDESSVRSRILHLNYVPQDDLPELYRGATVMAYPSLFEGFGLPPLEAMACGTPVLTSNCSSLPEVVGTDAMLVDPAVTDSIASGLSAMLSDSELRGSMRDGGMRRAQQFTWDQTALKTQLIYNGLHVQPSALRPRETSGRISR